MIDFDRNDFKLEDYDFSNLDLNEYSKRIWEVEKKVKEHIPLTKEEYALYIWGLAGSCI